MLWEFTLVMDRLYASNFYDHTNHERRYVMPADKDNHVLLANRSRGEGDLTRTRVRALLGQNGVREIAQKHRLRQDIIVATMDANRMVDFSELTKDDLLAFVPQQLGGTADDDSEEAARFKESFAVAEKETKLGY
jgi:hypothetical protein